MILRSGEIGRFKEVMTSGFAWLYGIHGIGKTTLVNEIKKYLETQEIRCKYIDLRAEYSSYPDFAACINDHAFSRHENDSNKNLKLFRDLSSAKSESPLCLIIDELEVYSPREIEPVRRLAESLIHNKNCSVVLFFVSSRSKHFYEEGDPISKTYSPFFYQLKALEKCEITAYLERLGYHRVIADEFAMISCGNPAILKYLLEEFHTKDEFNLDSIYTGDFKAKTDHYFSTLWSGLDPDLHGPIVAAATLLASLASREDAPESMNDDDILRISSFLNGMHAFGKQYHQIADLWDTPKKKLPFKPPVSPLFQTWVISQHSSNFNWDNFPEQFKKKEGKEQTMLGWKLETWKNLGTVLSVVSNLKKISSDLISAFHII